MNYSTVNLEQDIAELIVQSGTKEAFVPLTDELKTKFITIMVTQLKAFMLGRYNMSFEESGEILSKFPESIVNSQSFLDGITDRVNSGFTGGVQ